MWRPTPVRISDVFKQWSVQRPNQPALVEDGETWTYSYLETVVCETKYWLTVVGIRPGDRVMLVGDNSRALIALLLATAALDAWPVPADANIFSQDLAQLRDHCKARRVFRVCASSVTATEPKVYDEQERSVGRLGTIAMGPLNEQSQPEALAANAGDGVGALLYTSGTTGTPKGVMLSHKALLFVAEQSAKIRQLGPRDRLYGVLPVSHAVGLSVVLLGGLLSGATIYLARRFDPVSVFKSIVTDELTVLLGAPGMFSLMAEYAKMKGMKSFHFPFLRIIASASAPLHPSVKSSTESLFGLTLHNGYGLTEFAPTIAQTRPECPRTDTSVGPLFPGVEARLVGADGRDVAGGEVGELFVRGPNIMNGYYQAPEETRVAIDADGWFRTHDLARMQDGNLCLMGRTKELIIHFGHKVYPAEVEAVFNAHPEVMRTAIIGRPGTEISGEEDIVAIVQRSAGSSITDSELSEYAARLLVTYKRPSQIMFVADMPLTSTGKIMKEELRKVASISPHSLTPNGTAVPNFVKA